MQYFTYLDSVSCAFICNISSQTFGNGSKIRVSCSLNQDKTFKSSQCVIYTGCNNSRFLVVPDWYANGCCRVFALDGTNSVLNVYLVIKIGFIKYRFLKSTFRLRGRKRRRIAIIVHKQSTPTFLSAISPIIFHAKTSHTHDIPTKLRY